MFWVKVGETMESIALSFSKRYTVINEDEFENAPLWICTVFRAFVNATIGKVCLDCLGRTNRKEGKPPICSNCFCPGYQGRKSKVKYNENGKLVRSETFGYRRIEWEGGFHVPIVEVDPHTPDHKLKKFRAKNPKTHDYIL